MPRVLANGLQIEVESLGSERDPAIMLIMGLGMQLVAWPDELCGELVAAGFRVIRFDNRDVGLSEKLQTPFRVNLPLATARYLLRLPVAAPYRIEHMAADSIGVLDALEIESAHFVGASLGGMIAQVAAADNPQRCLSLTSIMSSSGSRHLPAARWSVGRQLLKQPAAHASPEELLDHLVGLFRVIGSPGFPVADAVQRERLRSGITRGHYPQGTARQLLAIIASGDRSAKLRTITRPTLVLHGEADPLVPLKHGIDCAQKIPGARLKTIPGMGHDLPSGVLPILAAEILQHLRANRG